MPFQTRGEVVDLTEVDLSEGSTVTCRTKGVREDDAGDNGGRRGTHAPTVGHSVVALESQAPGCLLTDGVKGVGKTAEDQVRGIRRDGSSTLSPDRDLKTRMLENRCATTIPDTERDPDRVKSRAKVGAAGGHTHGR